MRLFAKGIVVGALGVACLLGCNSASEDSEKGAGKEPPRKEVGGSAENTKAVNVIEEPKNGAPVALFHGSWRGVPVDEAAAKGFRWLVSVQGDDGGWGQDGGHDSDARQGIRLETQGNDVANTSLVCLALLRAGHLPGKGQYGKALQKGIDFILGQVEAAADKGLAVTPRKGTQIQRKLGPYIDTFLATLVLAEVDGQMATEKTEKRVRAGLEKCVAKVEANQQKDGSWNVGGGWAPVIGTSVASRALYTCEAKGVPVDPAAMAKVEEYTKNQYDDGNKAFKAGEAGAGIELYQAAQALEQTSRTEASRADNEELIKAASDKLSTVRFVSGFGSMGGEEFVSYLNISDSLCRTGGKKWTEWNEKMKERLVKLQNQDGTWAGHHCITGRVACTSSAVMTLLAERAAPRVE